MVPIRELPGNLDKKCQKASKSAKKNYIKYKIDKHLKKQLMGAIIILNLGFFGHRPNFRATMKLG